MPKKMYFTELDIGGLNFVTDYEVTAQVVADFLIAHEPAHVYTNVKVIDGYAVTCIVMEDEEDECQVYWRITHTELFEGK